MVRFLKLHMYVYLCSKLQVSGIILTSLYGEVVLPPLPHRKTNPKKHTQKQWKHNIELIFDLSLPLHIKSVFHWKFPISKVLNMLHHGSVGLVFTYTFLAYFCRFWSKKLCFYHLHFFIWWSIEFLKQNINQSETGIGDKKLSVEPYVNMQYWKYNLDSQFSK